jgi:hypothetical protein
MKKKISANIIFILIIALLGFLALTWFRGDFVINKADYDFSVNPTQDIYRYFYTWDSSVGLGLDNTRAIAKLFPYQLFINVFTGMGFSLVATEKILFYLLFTLSGIFMYFLLRHVLREKNYGEFAAFIGALFYMMNMWVAQFRWSIFLILPIFIYAAIPLMLMFFIKGIEKKDYKYAIYFAIASLFAAPSANNPIYLAPMIIILFVYSVYYVIIYWKELSNIKFFLKFAVIATIMFFLINFWWIVRPISAVTEAQHTVQIKYDPYSQIKLESRDASISSVIRMVGNWALKDDYKGDKYFTYADLYNSNSYIFIGYLIALVAFLGFLTKQKYRWLFGIIMLIGIFLSKGSHEPFGNIYLWLYDNIPGFWTFRSPYEKFGILIAFGMSAMIAISFASCFNYFEKKRLLKLLIVPTGIVFIAISCAIYALPFWDGEIIYPGGKIMPSARIKIPEYYQKLQNYLKNNKISRLFDLPIGNSFIAGPCPFKWGYFGGDPLPHFIDDSNILLSQPATFGDSVDYDFNKTMANKLQTIDQTKKLLNNYKLFLYLTDSHYLLLRDDIDWNFYGTPENTASTKESLLKKQEIQDKGQFGDLHLFEFESDNYPEYIYSPDNIYYYQGSLDGLKNLDSLFPDLGKNGLFINNTSLNGSLDKKNTNLVKESNEQIINLYPDPTNLSKEGNKYITKVDIDANLLGDYSVYAKLYDDQNTNYIKINGNNIKLPLKESPANWIDVGKIAITNTEIKTDFSCSTRSVLSEEFINSDSLWGITDASVNSNGLGQISNKIIDNAMNITSENHLAGARKKIEGLDPNKIYSLSFSYKNESGEAPEYAIEAIDKESDSSLGIIKKETLNSKNEWQTYTTFFEPKSSTIFIYFYSNSSFGLTSNSYDKINIDELTMPIESLVISKNNNNNLKNTPEINFAKINPTKYEIDIKGAKSSYYLDFLDAYNSNWQATVINNDKNKSIGSENHFVLNGYANSWRIDETGNYKVILEYKPQKYFYYGLAISTISLVIFLLLPIIFKKRKKVHV